MKVPIVKSDGKSNTHVIERLLIEGVKVNITAIFTEGQLLDVYDLLNHTISVNDENPTKQVIVSIFAGRISDTATNPFEIVQFGCKLLKRFPSVEILWAGCKEALSIQHAIDAGCHIITVPDSILDRIGRVGKDLSQFSIETVRGFNADGAKAAVVIE